MIFCFNRNLQKGVTAVAREQSLESEDLHPGQEVAPFGPPRVEADSTPAPRENCRVRGDLRIQYPLARTRDIQVVSVGPALRHRWRRLLCRGDDRGVSLALVQWPELYRLRITDGGEERDSSRFD